MVFDAPGAHSRAGWSKRKGSKFCDVSLNFLKLADGLSKFARTCIVAYLIGEILIHTGLVKIRGKILSKSYQLAGKVKLKYLCT